MTTIITKKDEFLNLTTILFTDKLKQWTSLKRETYDLSLMHTWTLDKFLNFQKDMRNTFINTSYAGMLENGTALGKSNKDYPNIYALFLLLISEIDGINNWEDVMTHTIRYTELIDYVNLNDLTSAERIMVNYEIQHSETTQKFHCLCGHSVSSHLYKIRNTKTHLEVWSGCCCIKKSKIISNKDLKECKEKYERKRLAELRQREQLEEQARRNKERFIAFELQQIEEQRQKFSQIIQVFISPYVLHKHKKMRDEKRQLKIGRNILINIIAKSKSKA